MDQIQDSIAQIQLSQTNLTTVAQQLQQFILAQQASASAPAAQQSPATTAPQASASAPQASLSTPQGNADPQQHFVTKVITAFGHTHSIQLATDKRYVTKMQGAPKFPHFDGQDSAGFRVFLAQFLQILDIHNYTERDACKLLLACMTDIAVDTARPIMDSAPHNDLQELINKLCLLFNAEGNARIASNLFASCRQRESDTVKEYSLRLESLYRQGFPTMPVADNRI